MEYRRFNHTIVARLDKGEDILEQIKEIAQEEKIELASVQALGAVDDLPLAYSIPKPRNIMRITLKDLMKLSR